MSLTVSQVITYVTDRHGDQWSGPEIAVGASALLRTHALMIWIQTTLSLICGFIVLGIGLLRLGRIVDLIPAPAVSGFMTGSALNILVGQVPGLMGITGFRCVHLLDCCVCS